MKEKTDLRVIRTQKSIYEAFFALLREKEFDKITVQDIADRAMINRNTFYLHYQDKQELLEKFCAQRLEHLDALLVRPQIAEFNEETIRQIIRKVLNEIAENQSFYQTMMREGGSAYFPQKLKKRIITMIAASFQGKSGYEQGMLCTEFVVSGFLSVIFKLLEGETPIQVEDTEELMYHLIFDNAYNYFLLE